MHKSSHHPRRLRIGLIFGGKSGEHQVSLQSAQSIYQALDKKKYQVILLPIDTQGRFRLADPRNYLQNSNDPKRIKLSPTAPIVTLATAKEGLAIRSQASGVLLRTVDFALPIVHGTFGEDGTLQGFLEICGVPYAGPGVLGSAVGMDKAIMKQLLREAGVPIGDFVALTKKELTPVSLSRIIRRLHFPIFVKPANSGSSVGISKAHNRRELDAAIQLALQYDLKIILEECIKGREIEVAVLGNDDPQASIPGEIKPTHEFYSYEAKYLDKNGAHASIPAAIPARDRERAQSLAIKTFRALNCAGLGRVDFFYTADREFFVNEINTLPGFTTISMYPKLWEASGLPYPKLLDRLIYLGLERHEQRKKLRRTF